MPPKKDEIKKDAEKKVEAKKEENPNVICDAGIVTESK
jgi:hypothetical protein